MWGDLHLRSIWREDLISVVGPETPVGTHLKITAYQQKEIKTKEQEPEREQPNEIRETTDFGNNIMFHLK